MHNKLVTITGIFHPISHGRRFMMGHEVAGLAIQELRVGCLSIMNYGSKVLLED
jgi:hypothetical protein